ncbi:hypothetical protein [Pedobacter montanisoli]|uniref:DUF3976 domain-containing protein n=1 Tax=Pedobacter montanisoli TaxID=2923277 RepID=A0ABS9ZZC5_9SPHI|nr:hypothetical protein [Pedobacter montanisoli]MCJ0743670.1 hypothetical protein [Pedobacter montanisoli]
MNADEIMMLLVGAAFLFFSIWLLFHMLKETKNGYRGGFGNDIKLYVGAVLGIVLGIVLIFKSLF